ncbi:unnamed protein product [Linum tenue]|uniref:BCCIP-like protein n=1 Tax=Linum tenue TaxID=586396 RepID=A0AAV0JTG8_9ROSI|nr:unnamed protein product [Linum tenue]
MTPNVKRPRRKLVARPVTFSPFARSAAHLASAYMIKRQMIENKLHESCQHTPNGKCCGQRNIDETDSDSDEESSEGVVQADFAFFDPKPDDFHGVKTLVQTFLDNEEWNLSGFVDLILEQTTVGTVVKLEDEDDDGLFSVVTALNLGRYKASDIYMQLALELVPLLIRRLFCRSYCDSLNRDDVVNSMGSWLWQDHKCMKELEEYILSVCHESNLVEQLRLLFSKRARDVGLLVSQRVVNLPPQLLPPLYDALFDEVSWAVEDEPTEELRNSFRFKTYLIVTKIYKHKKANGKLEKKADNEEEPVIYVKAEDELFHELSSWSFSFPLKIQHVTSSEASIYLLIFNNILCPRTLPSFSFFTLIFLFGTLRANTKAPVTVPSAVSYNVNLLVSAEELRINGVGYGSRSRQNPHIPTAVALSDRR